MKRSFEVYVCTAAERPWALEAWRLLDPHGDLIPHDQRPQRLVAKVKRKCLAQVLNIKRLSPLYGERLRVYSAYAIMTCASVLQLLCYGSTCMNLADG